MSFIDGLFLACFPLTPGLPLPITLPMKHIAYCSKIDTLIFLKKVRTITVPLLQFLRFFEAKLDVQQRTVCVRPSMLVPC